MANVEPQWTAGLGVRFTTATSRDAKHRRDKIKTHRACIATLTCVLVNADGKMRTPAEILRDIKGVHLENHRDAIMLFGPNATAETIKCDLESMHKAEVRAGVV